jgi:hypothetical protein
MRILAVLGFVVVCFACVTEHPPNGPGGPAQEPEPVVTVVPAEQPAAEEFVVTEEIYTRTFGEIEAFIHSLNQIIRNSDYDGWAAHLSEEYIRAMSDPGFLKAQSEKPLLKQSNIELAGLKDYFLHVVVPSRSQAQLDEIEFIDEDHVKALSVLRGTRVILYLLNRDDGEWKIGVW